jgi:hypothetical protein
MSIADVVPTRELRASRSLVVAIRPVGIVLPRYDGHDEVPLDLAELQLLESLATDGGRALDASADADNVLLAALRERGLLTDHLDPTGDAPSTGSAVPSAVVDPASAIDGDLVMPTPILVGCGPEGFEFRDHDGRVQIRLGAAELLAATAFRLPSPVGSALEAHTEQASGEALDATAFDELVARLVGAGVIVAFDPDHPDQARLTHQAENMRDGMRRQWRVHQEFDRLEAEHDAAGGPPGRVQIVGFHTSFSGLPASLGMIIAAAKGFDGGSLEEAYDFRPRLLWDDARLTATASKGPGIFLFSNYVWSTATNLEHSAMVKQLDRRHITVHGGPDTPKYEGDAQRFFADNPHIDVAVHGEGEATFIDMLVALRGSASDGPPDLSVLAGVPGLSFRDGDRVVSTGPRDRIADLDEIPSPILTGLYDGFIPAGGGPGGLNLETNRGCPYGCTFCDWGSATLSRVRKFDIDRVYAELEWCAKNGFKVMIADANFGIFERDVDISQRIADLKSTYGFPRFVGNNYAKNTVKHLSKIIEIFTDAGIVAEGKMSMQTFDEGTLTTIRRKNIKVEKYHDLSVEFRRNELPMSVDLMMGLPGATPETFRNDLQACIDRDLRAIVHSTVLLPNSPMNDPAYREENGIAALPGEEVRQSATFTQLEWETMHRLRMGFWLFENFGVLRQVGTYVHGETGRREIDFYADLIDHVYEQPERWPSMTIALRVVPDLMVPPVSWKPFLDEVGRYLIDVTGLADDPALRTVLAVQHALLPARDRTFPIVLELAHDYATWHESVAAQRDDGNHRRWHDQVEPLRSFPAANFAVDDPLDSCQRSLGSTYAFLSEDSAWDLASPVSRPRQAAQVGREKVVA